MSEEVRIPETENDQEFQELYAAYKTFAKDLNATRPYKLPGMDHGSFVDWWKGLDEATQSRFSDYFKNGLEKSVESVEKEIKKSIDSMR